MKLDKRFIITAIIALFLIISGALHAYITLNAYEISLINMKRLGLRLLVPTIYFITAIGIMRNYLWSLSLVRFVSAFLIVTNLLTTLVYISRKNINRDFVIDLLELVVFTLIFLFFSSKQTREFFIQARKG